MKFLSSFYLAGFFFLLGLFPLPAAPLKIVAAENFYGGVLQEIAGDQAEVINILQNPNQDPHEFTADLVTARAIADADLVVYNGISYDPWISSLLTTPGKPDRVVLNVSNLVGAKEGDNPHLWYSPRTMPALVDKVLGFLQTRDPAHAPVYQTNARLFQDSLQPELAEIASLRIHCQGLKVTATEPVFSYMLQSLGCVVLNNDFQIKIMNDTEPSVAETAAFENSLTSRTAKILFYNSQVTNPTTQRLQSLAQSSGVPIVGVTETQPPDQKKYVAWMLSELEAVQAALDSLRP